MSAAMKHSDNGQVFNSELMAKLNRRMFVDLKLNMNHQRQGYAVTNNGQFSYNCANK